MPSLQRSSMYCNIIGKDMRTDIHKRTFKASLRQAYTDFLGRKYKSSISLEKTSLNA